LKDLIMFGNRKRLTIVVAVAGLALSGCSSTGTKASGAAGPKDATSASASKTTPVSPKSGTPTNKQKATPVSPKNGTQKATPAPTSQGLASRTAAGDVELGPIRIDAKLGTPSAEVTITNHSSKRSNYVVDLSIVSAGGKTQLDAAMVSTQGLAPGKSTKIPAKFKTTQKLPTGATLTVVGVARLVA